MGDTREESPILKEQNVRGLVRDRVVQSGARGSTVPELVFALGFGLVATAVALQNLEIKGEVVRMAFVRDENPVYIGKTVSHLLDPETLAPLERMR